MPDAAPGIPSSTRSFPFWTLLGLLLVLHAAFLNVREFSETDESRSALIIRNMVEGHQWMLPRTPDGYLSEKPPLYYGLCAALSELFGLNEWTLRGVSVFMALGTILLTGVLARLFGSPRAAGLAMVAFASNLIMLNWGRRGMVDMTLTFFIVAGLTAYFAGRVNRLKPWTASLLTGVSFALATLTKGPIGFALPLAIIAGHRMVETRGRFWRKPMPWGAIGVATALALAIPLIWYIPGYVRGGAEFLNTCVLSENLYMPVGHPIGIGVRHFKPWHYYLMWQAFAFAVMIPILPETIRWACRRESGAARSFMLSWLGMGLAFFLAASNRRSYYLMPLQPAVAVMIGLCLDRKSEEPAPPFLRRTVGGFGALLAGVGMIVLLLLPFRESLKLPDSIPRNLALLACGALLSIAGGAALWIASRRRGLDIVHTLIAAGLLLVAGRTLVYEKIAAQSENTRAFVKEMQPKVPPGARIAFVSSMPAYSLEFYWPGQAPRVPIDGAEGYDFVFVRKIFLKKLPGKYEVLGIWKFPTPDQDVVLARAKKNTPP